MPQIGAIVTGVILTFLLTATLAVTVSATQVVHINLTTQLDTGGDLLGRCTIGFSGDELPNGQDPLQDMNPIRRDLWLSRFIGKISSSMNLLEITAIPNPKSDATAPPWYLIQFRAQRYGAVTDSTIDFALPSAALFDTSEWWDQMDIEAELKLPKRYRIVANPIPIDTTFAGITLKSESEIRSKLLRVRHRLTAATARADSNGVSEVFSQRCRLRILGLR